MGLTYQLEPDLDPAEFIDVLVRSTLAERRPVHDLETIRSMLRHADLIVTRGWTACWSAFPGPSATSASAPTCLTWRSTRRIRVEASAGN